MYIFIQLIGKLINTVISTFLSCDAVVMNCFQTAQFLCRKVNNKLDTIWTIKLGQCDETKINDLWSFSEKNFLNNVSKDSLNEMTQSRKI